MWDCSIISLGVSGSQICISKALAPVSSFSAHENPCWLVCIFKDCSKQGPRQSKAKGLSVLFRSDS